MGKNHAKSDITENAREILIKKLTDELVVLRTKLGLSQDELSNLIGISRQTYSMLETGKRKMSWGTYLSLILIFDNKEQTHRVIREAGIFPYGLFGVSDKGKTEGKLSGLADMMSGTIQDRLDEQALHAIETVIMLEYARCSRIPGDAVIKAFDGCRLRMRGDPDSRPDVPAEPDPYSGPEMTAEPDSNSGPESADEC